MNTRLLECDVGPFRHRALRALVAAGGLTPESPYSPGIRDLVLQLLYASGSALLLIPVQDVFGWRERINVPGLVDDKNWTWKLPVRVDALADDADARERQATLAPTVWANRGDCHSTSRSSVTKFISVSRTATDRPRRAGRTLAVRHSTRNSFNMFSSLAMHRTFPSGHPANERPGAPEIRLNIPPRAPRRA